MKKHKYFLNFLTRKTAQLLEKGAFIVCVAAKYHGDMQIASWLGFFAVSLLRFCSQRQHADDQLLPLRAFAAETLVDYQA